MKNIVLVRIDDRLIHGQVMTQWVRYRKFNTILIIDNETANDEFLSDIATMAVPSEFKSFVMTIADATEYLLGTPENEKILILVKTIETIDALVEQGVSIPDLNVGGIGMKPGRKTVYRNIAISLEEKEIFNKLREKGMNITVQIVPNDVAVDIGKII